MQAIMSMIIKQATDFLTYLVGIKVDGIAIVVVTLCACFLVFFVNFIFKLNNK